jgi:hypothetical protein
MKVWLPAIKRGLACFGALLAFVATAGALQLVTEEEAARPDDPALGQRRGSPTPAPEIEVVSPALSGLIKSPFHFKIRFKGYGRTAINRDSIVITYTKIPAIDVTHRIKAVIFADGIDIAEAELPAGTHPFLIRVKDERGRSGSLFFRIGVAK